MSSWAICTLATHAQQSLYSFPLQSVITTQVIVSELIYFFGTEKNISSQKKIEFGVLESSATYSVGNIDAGSPKVCLKKKKNSNSIHWRRIASAHCTPSLCRANFWGKKNQKKNGRATCNPHMRVRHDINTWESQTLSIAAACGHSLIYWWDSGSVRLHTLVA